MRRGWADGGNQTKGSPPTAAGFFKSPSGGYERPEQASDSSQFLRDQILPGLHITDNQMRWDGRPPPTAPVCQRGYR
jgi:hypothetical protein